MEIDVAHFKNGDDFSLGTLFVDMKLDCFTLEDEKRTVKVWGETRIPDGTYTIKLRTVGGMHTKYSKQYPWHKGMLWLQDVPGFEYVYIHVGNTDDDTAGCILVGDTVNIHGRLLESKPAYERLYKLIIAAMGRGEAVTINIQ